ncbi:MAG TPA: hypothetical protein VGS11_05355 [Candidatus Bathyarchaeia archaeon]|nr:hypothetical protein [Candidatus Bathyarchaeia archaeon]
MGHCPSCGKQFELHATVGLQEGLRVGDTAICIGCTSPLVLVELPYEFRLMTSDELAELDNETRELLERARSGIKEQRAQLPVSKVPRKGR